MASEYVSPEKLVSRAKASGCTGISWTFNEPALWFEYTLDSARLAKTNGLFTNYVTNGFLSEAALDRITPYLDVYRVDIKGFSDKTYQKIGHIDNFEGILTVTQKAKKYGIHVELVTNVIPGYNDQRRELKGIAAWIKNHLGPDTPWHLTRFYPSCHLDTLCPTPISELEKLRQMGEAEGLWYVYLGNVPGHPGENTSCHRCGQRLIERYVFDIIYNKIVGGRCPQCNTSIPGKFSP